MPETLCYGAMKQSLLFHNLRSALQCLRAGTPLLQICALNSVTQPGLGVLKGVLTGMQTENLSSPEGRFLASS